MKKEYFIILFAVFLLFSCRSCSNTPVITPESERFKVGFILPGSIDDNSWNQSVFQAISSIETDLSIEAIYRQEVLPEKCQDVISELIEADCRYIIGAGGQFIDSFVQSADLNPSILFTVIGDYEGNNRNLSAFQFDSSQAYLLAGVCAAIKTDTGKIGFIAGKRLDHILRGLESFKKGVALVDDTIVVEESFVGSFSDTEAGIIIAGEMIDNGVDIIVHNADRVGIAIINKYKSSEVFFIGNILDQNYLAPQNVVTSIVLDFKVPFYDFINNAIRGKLLGEQYKFSIRENAVKLADFHGLINREDLKNFLEFKEVYYKEILQ